MESSSKKKTAKKTGSIHPFVIIVAIVIVAAIVGYLLPAGEYSRYVAANGRTMVDPDTFQFVDRAPFSLVKLMTAIPRGIQEAANVVVITLMIGGAFGVIKKTGMLNLGVTALVKAFSRQKLAIIFVLFAVFSIICGFIGVPELCLVYIPVLMPLLFALGFDSMTTVAISLCATAAGFSAAFSAPATVGLGQTIAELPMYSGMGFRAIVVAVLALSAAIYTAVYAKKVMANPSSSIVYEEDIEKRKEYAAQDNEEQNKLPRVKLAGILTIIMFIGLIVGVIVQQWGFNEMAGYFIVMGVVAGLSAGMTLGTVCASFESGMKDMLVGALICGIARGIAVVLTDAKVMDTIIMYLANIVTMLPAQIASIGMFIVTTLFNGVLASGSGKAVITLPIMIPLADMAHVNRQIAILAYQMGDGITNILWPASGYFMAALAIGKISFKKWVKWSLPLILIWCAVACVVLIVATAMSWGPF